MNRKLIALFLILGVIIAGSVIGIVKNFFEEPKYTELKEGEYPKAPELEGIAAWINSEPLTLEELRGKVVLLDFWTYSCINCIRTLPYLKAWHAEYADDGLVIIGVHTPEFFFEKKYANVKKRAEEYELEYPIALD
ncbi:MAG: redoxin domain-containing protein, partial [Candidatus Hydrothermarchaeales archaeon]